MAQDFVTWQIIKTHVRVDMVSLMNLPKSLMRAGFDIMAETKCTVRVEEKVDCGREVGAG